VQILDLGFRLCLSVCLSLSPFLALLSSFSISPYLSPPLSHTHLFSSMTLSLSYSFTISHLPPLALPTFPPSLSTTQSFLFDPFSLLLGVRSPLPICRQLCREGEQAGFRLILLFRSVWMHFKHIPLPHRWVDLYLI
jgi:hypothetical protein